MSSSELPSHTPSSKNTEKEGPQKDQNFQKNGKLFGKFFPGYPFWIGGVVIGFLIFLTVQSIVYHKTSNSVSISDQQIKMEQSKELNHEVPAASSSSPSLIAPAASKSLDLEKREEEAQTTQELDEKKDSLETSPSASYKSEPLKSWEESELRQDDIQALEIKIKDLEQKVLFLEKQAQQKELIWYYFQSLQNALEESRNFEQELHQYREVTRQNSKIQEQLDLLTPYAQTKLLTVDQLISNFEKVKDELHQILTQRLTGLHKLRLYLMPWVQIEKIKKEEMTLSPSLIQSLQKSVNLKDFDEVLILLSLVKEEMPPALKDWYLQVLRHQQRIKIIKALLDQTIFEMTQPTNFKKES